MENKFTNILLKSTLNGAFHKGNFIWGGAMNICWDTLSTDVIKQPLQLEVKGDCAQHVVDNFTKAKFSQKDLSEESYYTKAGFGQATLDRINKQCKAKFPQKTFADIKMNLADEDIISYAYFVKKVQYLNPFALNPQFNFGGKVVKGFKATSANHFDNIRVCHYENDHSFVIKLLLKEKDEELFIIKGSEQALPQQIVSTVSQHANGNQRVLKGQKFMMPIVQLDVKRTYSQLINASCKNTGFTKYKIAEMFENIKFKIDEVGAKVENEAVIAMILKSVKIQQPKRNFILNSPFWVVMKQKDMHPYFVAQINNTQFMTVV